jgi:hypothetical protein
MTTDSMGRYSEIGLTTVRAFLDKISTTITGTTITISDTDNYLLANIYNNGAVVITSGTNKNKIANITTVNAASNIIVVDATMAGCTTNDGIAVLPRPLAYMCISNESLKENVTWDDTECIQAWQSTQHTPVTIDVGGDLGAYVGSESPALHLVMAAAMGISTSAAGVNGNSKHMYSPGASVHGLTVYVMRGNHVALMCYGGTAIDTLVLDQPSGANATARITLSGGFGIQEVGGAGYAFSTGAGTFWNPTSPTPDPKRMGFRHLVVSKAATPMTYAESGNVTIARNNANERRLGDMFIADPQSTKFVVTGTVVQWFETDTELLAWRGGNAKAFVQEPSVFDLQYKWTGTATSGTYLQIDAYDAVWRDSAEPIVEGRIKETLTWQAKYQTSAGKSILITYDNNDASLT